MEVFGNLAGGFATALQPVNVAFLFIGVTLGLVIGVLPGLGGTSGVAILLPISIVVARGDIQGANATTAVILLAGIYCVPVTIGLFGIGEILASAEEAGIGYVEQISARLGFNDLFQAVAELRKRLWLVCSNAVIGFFFGVLPGHGATAASFLGYGLARQYAKDKSGFGKGEISGIMGPQATADAGGVASLVPMITLGVPGSPTSAVIMAGLFVWGLQPGPLLFLQHQDFVWGLIASIYVGHFLTFMLCLLAVPLLAAIMRIPY